MKWISSRSISKSYLPMFEKQFLPQLYLQSKAVNVPLQFASPLIRSILADFSKLNSQRTLKCWEKKTYFDFWQTYFLVSNHFTVKRQRYIGWISEISKYRKTWLKGHESSLRKSNLPTGKRTDYEKMAFLWNHCGLGYRGIDS